VEAHGAGVLRASAAIADGDHVETALPCPPRMPCSLEPSIACLLWHSRYVIDSKDGMGSGEPQDLIFKDVLISERRDLIFRSPRTVLASRAKCDASTEAVRCMLSVRRKRTES